MTTHEMRLHPAPFELIRSGSKTVEIRLHDEKRRELALGDQIEFALRPELKERFKAEIVGLDTFENFKDAFSAYPPREYGSESADEWKDMYQYYSPEEEKKYGVLCIRLRLVTT